MRICVSGASGIGKSTFIQDFLKNWPSYKSSGQTYRDLIKSENLSLNTKGDKESQRTILNCLLDTAMAYKKDANIIHDRGTLDNLVYSLWLKAKEKGDIDEVYLQRTFQLVKQSMCFYDVIFYIPYDENNITIENKENRETDIEYNKELDNFFKAIYQMYCEKNTNLFPFNDSDGVPALIEIFGNKQERLEIAKLYIAPDGNQFEDKESLLSDFMKDSPST